MSLVEISFAPAATQLTAGVIPAVQHLHEAVLNA